MAGRRTGVSGKSALRKFLREAPDAVREEIVDGMEKGGREMLAAQRAAARRKTGALAGGLRMRLAKKSLNMKVGIIGKASARKLFYARIIGGGRKAQVVRAKKRATGTEYDLRVAAMPAQPVIDPPAAKAARKRFFERMRGVWNKVLREHYPRGTGGDD